LRMKEAVVPRVSSDFCILFSIHQVHRKEVEILLRGDSSLTDVAGQPL
jgi:hypothetical protein